MSTTCAFMASHESMQQTKAEIVAAVAALSNPPKNGRL
jgi:hypothetical protein